MVSMPDMHAVLDARERFSKFAQKMVDDSPFGQQISKLKQQHSKRMAVQSRAPIYLAPRVVVMPRHAALAAIIPGDSIPEQVITSGLISFLSIYNTVLISRLVLTWFPNPPEFIMSPLQTIADPYLNLFRGIIPPIGGTLDLSPILAFVTLSVFTNTATALPAEVPEGVELPARRVGAYAGSGFVATPNCSKSQQAWNNRVAASKAIKQAGVGSSMQ